MTRPPKGLWFPNSYSFLPFPPLCLAPLFGPRHSDTITCVRSFNKSKMKSTVIRNVQQTHVLLEVTRTHQRVDTPRCFACDTTVAVTESRREGNAATRLEPPSGTSWSPGSCPRALGKWETSTAVSFPARVSPEGRAACRRAYGDL